MWERRGYTRWGAAGVAFCSELASPPLPTRSRRCWEHRSRQLPQTAEVSAGTVAIRREHREADSVFPSSPLPDPVPAAIRKGPDLTSFQPFSPSCWGSWNGETRKKNNNNSKKENNSICRACYVRGPLRFSISMAYNARQSLLDIFKTHQTHSYHRALALSVPSAQNTFP